MAVSPPLLKAHPDVSKLNGFSSCMVTVTKHQVSRGGEGVSVVATQVMTKEQIFNLQGTELLLKYGPGYYHFNVTDTGGNGEDEWRVKLGTEATAQEGPMPAFGSSPMTPVMAPMPNAPLDSNVTQIMPGFFYNDALGLLTTPWRATVQWRQGDPLPQPPPTTTTSTAPTSTQWAYPGWNGQQGGWGYPATNDDSKLEALKMQMAEQARQLESERRQRDEDKREREAAEQRAEMRRLVDDTNKRFEVMIEKMTAKPAGPSEESQRLQRELDETKRRTEETERENRRREETRAADDRHREEMRLVREEIKAATANKTDPMMTLFAQILQSQSTSAAETARMMRESGAVATAASERATTQILELARSQRDGVAEASKIAVDSVRDSMGLQKDVFMQALDLAGSNNTSPWVNLAGQALEKIGAVGEALAARAQMQQAAQAQYIPPAPVPQRQQPPQQTVRGVPIPHVPAVPPATDRPGYIDTGGRPAGAEYNTETDEWMLPGGHRVKNSIVGLHGWKHAIADLTRRVSLAGPPTVPTANGMNGGGAPLHVVPETTAEIPGSEPSAPAPARGRGKPKRGARRGGTRVQTSTETAPAAATTAYDTAGVAATPPEEVFEAVKDTPDPVFFGDIWSFVQQLRANPQTAENVVKYILQGRAQLQQMGKRPPAMEIIEANHFEVLVLRMFPDYANEPPDQAQRRQQYRAAIVEGLKTELGGDGGEEDDDGDDDGPDEANVS